jgi:hypothetical protein
VRDWSHELSDADRAFDEALRLLDQRHGEQAEGLLELVVRASRTSGDGILRTRALCVLGEWLLDQGRSAAGRERLLEALAIEVIHPERVAAEHERARELLAAHDRREPPGKAHRGGYGPR